MSDQSEKQSEIKAKQATIYTREDEKRHCVISYWRDILESNENTYDMIQVYLTIPNILYTSEGINKLTDLSNCSSQIGK